MANTEIKNEVMDAVIEDVVVEEVIAKPNVLNTVIKGGAVVAGIAAAAVVVKKIVDTYKAKKELRKPDKEIIVDEEDIETVVVEAE